jgi:hypothetical protein
MFSIHLKSGRSFNGKYGQIRIGQTLIVGPDQVSYWRAQSEVTVTAMPKPAKPAVESKPDPKADESIKPDESKPDPVEPKPVAAWDARSDKSALLKAASDRGVLVSSDDTKAEIISLLTRFDAGERLPDDRLVDQGDDE